MEIEIFSEKPTDIRVYKWNLAEIPLVDPKLSLLRVKVSEISLNGMRGISDSLTRDGENLGAMSGYFISQIQQGDSWCQSVLFFIPRQA